MSAYYSRTRRSGERDLLKRTRKGAWKCYRMDRSEWFEFSPPAVRQLEGELAAGRLVPVAALVLGGEAVTV